MKQWKFFPRGYSQEDWDRRMFPNYPNLKDVYEAMLQKSKYFKGMIEMRNEVKARHFTSTYNLKWELKQIKDKETIHRIYIYDVGFFVQSDSAY